MKDDTLLRKIEETAGAADRERESLYKLIRRALEQGIGLRVVARAAGLTHGGVARIRDRGGEE